MLDPVKKQMFTIHLPNSDIRSSFPQRKSIAVQKLSESISKRFGSYRSLSLCQHRVRPFYQQNGVRRQFRRQRDFLKDVRVIDNAASGCTDAASNHNRR